MSHQNTCANDLLRSVPPLTAEQVTFKRLLGGAMVLVLCVSLHASFTISNSQPRVYRRHADTDTNEDSDLFKCDGKDLTEALFAEQEYVIVIFSVSCFIISVIGILSLPLILKLVTCDHSLWALYWRNHMKLYSIWEAIWHLLLLFTTYSTIPYSYCQDFTSGNVFYQNQIFTFVNAFTCSKKDLERQHICRFGNNTWDIFSLTLNYFVGCISVVFMVLAIRKAWMPHCKQKQIIPGKMEPESESMNQLGVNKDGFSFASSLQSLPTESNPTNQSLLSPSGDKI